MELDCYSLYLEVYMDHLLAKTGGGLDSYLIVYILNITESKKSNILQNIWEIRDNFQILVSL